MPDPSHTLILSPIGDIPLWVIQVLSDRLSRVFGFDTRVARLLENLDFAYDSQRNQYYSTQVLEVLCSLCPKEGIKILGVTREDLFIPILTHVYGEAQLGGKAAVISVSRLISGQDLGGADAGEDRVFKEAVHELGHCFDLRHCEDEQCIMHYCRKIQEVDKKSSQFCRYCRVLLQDYMGQMILDQT
ncbi:MAG: archaemetzincin family Zn-dependent metalloprotease [Desulfobacter sp.]|nr:archaemetzincin family Zn-dependent metalloprotease [Desulfobacter sp.]WDP84609.1 MAG: archaemetzincin family Zn-dependent metalloprotease [Desulfobacter sp.]